MIRPKRLPMIATASLALAALGAPITANAQSDTELYVAGLTYDIAFFERVTVGSIELTPFGIVRDQRCADARFCYRPEDMRVSVVMHDREYPYEVVLFLGRPVEVDGGYLILHDPGTRPRDRGALQLTEYALDIEFIPAPPRDRRSQRAELPRP
ncbi:hypothetical protein [Qipengyuania sp. ASV99]|uniref:hypothetical protein n=1 Tax=Qipengyuania sp. ASV99 TaxID=3399681 RepID=UPI003A4C55E9